MIISGSLEINQAYNSVDWKSIILIAGMLTARELIEMYFEKRRRNLEKKSRPGAGTA